MKKFWTIFLSILVVFTCCATLAGIFSGSNDKSEEPEMITFYIGQSEKIECSCPEGYTLQEYFDSEYFNEEVSANDYVISDGYLGYQGSAGVLASTVIVAGATYP